MIFFVLCLIWFFEIIILIFRIRGGVEDIRLEAKAKNTKISEAKDRNAQARSQEFEMEGLFWSWKQHQTILIQILIGLHSDWADFSVQT